MKVTTAIVCGACDAPTSACAHRIVTAHHTPDRRALCRMSGVRITPEALARLALDYTREHAAWTPETRVALTWSPDDRVSLTARGMHALGMAPRSTSPEGVGAVVSAMLDGVTL